MSPGAGDASSIEGAHVMLGIPLLVAAGTFLGAVGSAGCSSSEFTAQQTDASERAGGAAGSSGGPGSDAIAATGSEAGSGGGAGGAETGATGGESATGGTRAGSDGQAAAGDSSGALDSGASPDASLPCPTQDRWCEGGAGLPLPPPLAHWRFDGNLTDSSGNGHDAERVGTITYAVNGTEAGAIFTDGWGRNYSFAPPFRNTLDSFTLSVRLRVDAYDREMPVFGLSAPGLDALLTNKWLLHLCAQNHCAGVTTPGVVVETELGDAGDNSYATLGPLPPVGAWVHLALVVNANQIAYYADGVLVSSSFYTPAQTLATVIHLGGTTSTTSSVNGAIDDIRVFDEVFDSAQVAALFAGF